MLIWHVFLSGIVLVCLLGEDLVRPHVLVLVHVHLCLWNNVMWRCRWQFVGWLVECLWWMW